VKLLVCKTCKSSKVHVQTWVDPNTGEIMDIHFDFNVENNHCLTYCCVCAKNSELEESNTEVK
jgi:hypothetical protein